MTVHSNQGPSAVESPVSESGPVEVNKRRVGKMALLLFLLSMGVVVFFLGVLYVLGSRAELAKLKAREEAVVALQSRYIMSETLSIFTDLIFIAKNECIDAIFDPVQDARDQGIRDLEEEFLRFSSAKASYDQIRLIDLNGDELLRVNFNSGSPVSVASDQLQNKKHRYYFTKSLAVCHGGMYISPLDLNVENQEIELPYKPMIRFGTPVFDKEGKKQGVILFNYLAECLLNRVAELSKTSAGDLYLLNKEGYYLKSPNPENEWGFMFPHKKDLNFGTHHPEIWPLIKSAEFVQEKRAQGLYSACAVNPLECLNLEKSSGLHRVKERENQWKIVSFVSQSTIYKAQRVWVNSLILVGIAMGLILAVSSWFVALGHVFRQESIIAQRKLIGVLSNALERIKMLNGMIPICAKCKKIRDDEGYWKSVELYIEEHSEATFSHGICPDCSEEMYGDQSWWKKKKEDAKQP